MDVTISILVIAFMLCIAEQIRARGKSLVTWAVLGLLVLFFLAGFDIAH
jgi:hypothetical protein